MASLPLDQIEGLLDDVQDFDFAPADYVHRDGPLVDERLRAKLDSLTHWARRLGNEELVRTMEQVDFRTGGAIHTLEFVKKTVLPEFQQVIEQRRNAPERGIANRVVTADEGLTRREIYTIVTRFVGMRETNRHELRGFSHRTLSEFFEFVAEVPEDCRPGSEGLSKKDRLVETLLASPPTVQLRLVEGLLDEFHPAGEHPETDERARMRPKVEALAERLRGQNIALPTARSQGKVVRRALSEAEILLEEGGAASAVDRVHGALHGYLKELCLEGEINHEEDEQLTSLYAKIREKHPRLQHPPSRAGQSVDHILKVQSKTVEELNWARNNRSGAHPRPRLPEAEARLVINAGVALFNYLHEKTSRTEEDVE